MAATWEVSGTTATYKNDAGKVVAKITGLASGLTATDGAITGITVTEGTDGGTGTISLSSDVLTTTNVKLELKNGGNYRLALGNEVTRPNGLADVEPVINAKKGTATFSGTIAEGGYTLSLDNKNVVYTPEGEIKVVVSGVASTATADDFEITETGTDNKYYASTITMKPGALGTKKVTVSSGKGYQLVLDSSVSQDGTTARNFWNVSGTTATYKNAIPAYYTYDSSTNAVTYTKQKDNKTLATLNNIRKGLTVVTDETTGNSALYYGEGDETVVTVNSSNDVITLRYNSFNAKNVTLKNGSGEDYSLAIAEDDQHLPVTANETWTVSGTAATLKGTTSAGYAKTNDTTITYVKDSGTKSIVLATVKGLASGVAVGKNDDAGKVGMNTKVDGETVFTEGLSLSETGGDTINISANVLGTKNATITSTAGFSYKFALDDGTVHDGAGAVPTTAVARTFWHNNNGSSLKLKGGYANYYTLTDSTTITQTDEKIGDEVATVKGLKMTGLKIVDGNIDGITVSGQKITVSSDMLNKEDVTLSNVGNNKYALALGTDVSSPENGTMWIVNGTNAVLRACKTEGYTLTNSTTITHDDADPKSILATLTGLKSGLKVKDDNTIDGIVATEFDFSEENADKTITLSKKVLGTTDITLDEVGLDHGYSLALDSETVEPIEPTRGWTVNNGTASYVVETKKAGFEEIPTEEGGETIYQLAYRKEAKTTTKITGLSANASEDDLTGPDDNGVITLSSNALEKNATLTNAKGGSYTLALASDVTAPVLGSDLVWTSKNNTATLKGTVTTAGYEVSGDALSVVYTPASENGADTLATITGIKSGLTSSALNDGITRNGSELVLGNSVLNNEKLTVKGGAYTLALGNGVSTAPTDKTGWVTSGTTATYKSYKSEYYTPDAKGTTIKFTKGTAGTTYATVKGIAKGADLTGTLDGDTTGGTITLEAKHLGTTKVTLTGSNFKLALDSAVPKAAVNAEEWVTSGATAKYQAYKKAYYTLSGNNTVNYTAPGKATVYATVTGIASGATVTDVGKVITLSADQLAGKAVTLTGEGYSLALGSDVEKATGGDTSWTRKGTSATYKQAFTAGYTLANANKITYSAAVTDRTLATLNDLSKADEESTEETLDGVEVGTTQDSDGKYTITLSSEDLFGNKGKVTLKADDYKLAIDGETLVAPAEGSTTWTLNKNKGTAVYAEVLSEGYTVSNDAKTVTHSAEKNTTLATISGLDKNKLKALITEEATATVDDNSTLASTYGISLSGTKISLLNNTVLGTSKITLGKNDQFEFDVSAVAPATGSNKWSVKGTTATYSATTTEGYNATDTKTVAYVKETVGDTIVQVTGLKKGIGTDGTKVGIPYKEEVYDEETDKTTKVTKYSDDVILSPAMKTVDLNSAVLGTTDIKLVNGEDQSYSFGTIGGTKPSTSDPVWSFSSGTATYKQSQTGGHAKTDSTTVTYTASKTTTLATVKGLNKKFTGNLNNAISTSGETITVQSGLLGTSKVTLTIPNGGTKYSFALGSTVAQDNTAKTEWVTNGTKAVYKNYNQAYYTIDANNGSILYHASKDNKTYATITNIRKGVDINSASAVSDGTVGGTITLTAAMLGTSKVTVANAKGNTSADFTLAIAGDVPTVSANVTEWVTNDKGTAVYKTYNKGSYKVDNNAIVYTKGTGTATDLASITGADSDISATLASDGKTFVVMGNELTTKVGVGSKLTEDTPDYNFSFNNDYNNSAIVGSKNADVITVAGDGLSITGGKGDDVIDLGSNDRVGNLFIYAKGDGNDTVSNFQAGDAIKITSGFNTKSSYVGGEEITVGSGKITLEFLNDEVPDYITINGKSYSTDTSEYSSDLLADDNYSTDAAQLSSIVESASIGLTPYDINSGLNLTKEDAFTASITYAKDK